MVRSDKGKIEPKCRYCGHSKLRHIHIDGFGHICKHCKRGNGHCVIPKLKGAPDAEEK